MQREDHPPESAAQTAAQFATTHWSVVLAAGHESSPDAREALETLCRNYWYPLYAYARRCGQNTEDAKDLVQGFFAYLLSRHALRLADPAKGRFRSYLLSSLKHFWSAQNERARAQKRGGGKPVVSLDETVAEGRYRLELRDDWTPDRLYEREWALTLLEKAQPNQGRADLSLGRDGFHSVPERECGRGWNASRPKWAIPMDTAVLGEPLAAGFR